MGGNHRRVATSEPDSAQCVDALSRWGGKGHASPSAGQDSASPAVHLCAPSPTPGRGVVQSENDGSRRAFIPGPLSIPATWPTLSRAPDAHPQQRRPVTNSSPRRPSPAGPRSRRGAEAHRRGPTAQSIPQSPSPPSATAAAAAATYTMKLSAALWPCSSAPSPRAGSSPSAPRARSATSGCSTAPTPAAPPRCVVAAAAATRT